MELASSDVLAVLNYLLPGLVATWTFRRLTPHDKPRDLEALIEALLFTAAVQPMVLLTQWLALRIGQAWTLGSWTENTAFVTSVILGLVTGFIVGVAANKDWVHRGLRKLRVTKQTSYSSEWYRNLFCEERFVLLTLKNGERILGWPEEFPNSPDNGHFKLTLASWIPADKEPPRKLTNASSILIAATDVRYLELMKFQKEIDDEQKSATSAEPSTC